MYNTERIKFAKFVVDRSAFHDESLWRTLVHGRDIIIAYYSLQASSPLGRHCNRRFSAYRTEVQQRLPCNIAATAGKNQMYNITTLPDVS